MHDTNDPVFPHLVVGLGNPGRRYQGNRHNIGFQVVEALAVKRNLPFVLEETSFLATPQRPEDSSGLVLLKPQTYMNLSGEAVIAWLVRQDLEPEWSRIMVVCDDLALPLGTLRMRGKGSSGGQNGLGSIIDHLETDRFPRLRLGIDGTEGGLQPENWPDYVLADFEENEAGAARDLVQRAVQALETWVKEGLESASSRFNGRPEPETGE